MLKKVPLLILASLSIQGFAATITVTGPITVCPGVKYSYTASARNAFGSQNGNFAFYFYLNGVQVGYAGGIDCDNNSQYSYATHQFMWPGTGNFSISVQFHPRNTLGCSSSWGYLNGGLSRVVTPEGISDLDGGLTFCTPGQTRTLRVPAVTYNQPATCNWHHAFDYIVPSGWSVTPTPPWDMSEVVTIPGGIRTHSFSVDVTAPNTALQSGFSGNFFITVRTEPAWPFPKEISRQIWIGPYGSNMTISGQAQVCPGNLYTYTMTPPGGQKNYSSHSYSWVKPSNWTIQGQASNYITLYVPQYSPDYGPVRAFYNNGCGSEVNGITTYPGYSCGGYMMTAYPNPGRGRLNIEMINNERETTEPKPKLSKAVLMNAQGQIIREGFVEDDKMTFDTSSLKKGVYYLRINVGSEVVRRQILVD
jgi:hypothetical protein